MSRIPRLLDRINGDPRFQLLSPMDAPIIRPGHVLPEDVATFYDLAGGIICYENDAASDLHVVSSERFIPVNHAMFEEEVGGESDAWYVLIDAADGNYISVDCDPDPRRNGRCYRSFLYTHPARGSSPIVARSFSEFLQFLLDYQGDFFYWEEDDFEAFGDAYGVAERIAEPGDAGNGGQPRREER